LPKRSSFSKITEEFKLNSFFTATEVTVLDKAETMEELDDTDSCALFPSNVDGVDSAELFDTNPRHFTILSGISPTLFRAWLPLSKLPSKTKAFSAQNSASLGEKHTPKTKKSRMFDASSFNDEAIQTSGILIRPCPVGVSLSGAGVSLPYAALGVGAGEMALWGTLEEYFDTVSFTGIDFFDSSSEKGGSDRNDLIFMMLILL